MLRLFKSNNTLLALMFFEVLLLPMWNIGPIPFKFSFLIILYSLFKGIPKNTLTNLFLVLIVLLWVGKFYSYVFLNEIDFSLTIRSTINYLLIISAISYSKKIKKIDNLNWIALLAISFSVINIVILIFGPLSPSIISFYKLDFRLEEGLFFVRNPGIMGNPNASALIGNLILLFWIVSNKFNLITLKSGFWNWVVILSIGLANLSFVSRSGFLAYFLLITWYFFQNFEIKKVLNVFLSFVISGFLFVYVINKVDPEKIEVLSYGVETIINFQDQISDEIIRDRGQGDSNRLDKISLAFDNFFISPIFGVGSDRSTGNILNRTLYHNDWSEILVSTGFLGIIIYFFISYKLMKIYPLFILPLLIPGLTNSFLFQMQITAFYFFFIELIYNINKSSMPIENKS
tara:strand:+ start:76 stop:1281 length:1206 start_codon:yes stop_codon:yes gene_type:complete